MRLSGVLLLATLAGCVADVAGSEGRAQEPATGPGSPGGSETTVTLSKYFDEIAKIHCDQAFLCRASFPPDRGYPFEAQWGDTIEECTRRLIAAWDPALIETEIAKGRIMFDGTAAVSCLNAVTFAACPEYWNRGIEWADSCYHVVVPTVPPGGACDSDYSCTTYACDTTRHVCR